MLVPPGDPLPKQLGELDRAHCDECDAPVYLCRMRDGSVVELDGYPMHNLVVLNGKGQGMPASYAFYRHSATCIGDGLGDGL